MNKVFSIMGTVKDGLVLHLRAFLKTLPFALLAVVVSGYTSQVVIKPQNVEDINSVLEQFSGLGSTALGLFALGWIVSMFAYALVLRVLWASSSSGQLGYGEAVADGVKKFPKFLVLAILLFAIGWWPFLILFIPVVAEMIAPFAGIYYAVAAVYLVYVAIRLLLAPVALMSMDDSVGSSMHHSFDETRGCFWRVFAIMLLGVVTVVVLKFIIVTALTFAAGVLPLEDALMYVTPAIAVIFFAFYPSLLTNITQQIEGFKAPKSTPDFPPTPPQQ